MHVTACWWLTGTWPYCDASCVASLILIVIVGINVMCMLLIIASVDMLLLLHYFASIVVVALF